MPTAIEQFPQLPAHPLDKSWQSDLHRLWIQVDCQALSELLSGRSALDGEEIRAICVLIARQLFGLYGMGWRPLNDS